MLEETLCEFENSSVLPRFIQNCENNLKVMVGGDNLEVETGHCHYIVFGMAADRAQL